MGKKRLSTDIDKKRLLNELAKRNITLEGASVGCGFTKSYLSQKLRIAKEQDHFEIPVSMTMLLFEKFNIRTEAIIYEEPKVSVAKEEPKQTAITADVLYKIIYTAVREALKG